MYKNNNKGFTLIEFIILIFIISFLIIMGQPNHTPKITQDEKDCFNNQRALNLAIESYQIDKDSPIENVYPGLDYENFEKQLLATKYCLKEPLKPTYKGCSYGYASNTVFCVVHGTVKTGRNYNEQKPIPEYDKSLEKPFSSSYNDFRNKIINENKTKQGFTEFGKILLGILMIPAVICIYFGPIPIILVIIVLVILYNVKKSKMT